MILNLILGDQLFEKHPCFGNFNEDFAMIECYEQAKRLNYHKYKLAYIFSSMREYASKYKQIQYFKLDKNECFESQITKLVRGEKYTKIKTARLNNKFFKKMLLEICGKLDLELEELESEMFLFPKFEEYLEQKTTKGLLMNNFYIYGRQKLGILVENKKPIGEKWSFDEENRKKYPKNIQIPNRNVRFKSQIYAQVALEIETLFPNNPGILPEFSHFALNSEGAKECLEFFLNDCLANFGAFEDAMSNKTEFGFHSCLSPYLNNGLLTPRQVLEALDLKLKTDFGWGIFDTFPTEIPANFNSIEGFVRQIIGWREWTKGLYNHIYDQDLSKYNFWKHTKPLPNYFYEPTKYIDEIKDNTPLLDCLLKTEKFGYNHHIERLMILANWCLLEEYNPECVFNWFAEMYVDSAEWVMVANVLGMGIFADGGIFATKPYLAGGNYIKKMSDYPGSKIWEPIWTDKFWKFLLKHEDYFKTNPRMAMLISVKKKKNLE
jgi:deoxyribodipyrimidine photolyase-related protein